MPNPPSPVCTDVTHDWVPDIYMVYLVRHPDLGWYQGHYPRSKLLGFTQDFWKAERFDSLHDLTARLQALAVRDKYMPGGRVVAFKRHEFFGH